MAKSHVGSASLIQFLKANLREERIDPPLTADSWMRASSFAGICPREEVLRAKLKIARREEFNADSLLNFGLGHQIHWFLQHHILSASSVALLRGRWMCEWCGSRFGGNPDDEPNEIRLTFRPERQIPRPAKCEVCTGTDFTYVEQHVGDYEYRLAGHPDGIIVLPGMDGPGIIEAKSISPRGSWEIKKVPKYDHVIQAQIYLWLTGYKWSLILYFEKGAYGMGALTEHLVERDEDTIQAIKGQIHALREGLAGVASALPPRICQKDSAPRAIVCPCAKACFEDESDHVVAPAALVKKAQVVAAPEEEGF